MNPVGLPHRSRIRDRLAAVDRVSIAVNQESVLDFGAPMSRHVRGDARTRRTRVPGGPGTRLHRDSPLRGNQFD